MNYCTNKLCILCVMFLPHLQVGHEELHLACFKHRKHGLSHSECVPPVMIFYGTIILFNTQNVATHDLQKIRIFIFQILEIFVLSVIWTIQICILHLGVIYPNTDWTLIGIMLMQVFYAETQFDVCSVTSKSYFHKIGKNLTSYGMLKKLRRFNSWNILMAHIHVSSSVKVKSLKSKLRGKFIHYNFSDTYAIHLSIWNVRRIIRSLWWSVAFYVTPSIQHQFPEQLLNNIPLMIHVEKNCKLNKGVNVGWILPIQLEKISRWDIGAAEFVSVVLVGRGVVAKAL